MDPFRGSPPRQNAAILYNPQTMLSISFDHDDPSWSSLCERHAVSFEAGCSCKTARRRFDPKQVVVTDGRFALRLVFKSEARFNEAKRYYHTNLPTASNLAEYLPKIRTLFYELASLCECESHCLLGRLPKGSDRLRAANPTAHLCAALGSEAVLRRKINRGLAKKIAKPLESPHMVEGVQSLGHVYVLSCASRDLIKIGFTYDHPYKRRSEINSCYPDAVLVAYTVKIYHPHRVEQLAHAELALQRQIHDCPVCRTAHREWFRVSQDLATRVVLRWAKWMASQPYGEHSRLLHRAWGEYLDEKRTARLIPASEKEKPAGPHWGTWTAFRPSTGRKDFSANVVLKMCEEEGSPFV